MEIEEIKKTKKDDSLKKESTAKKLSPEGLKLMLSVRAKANKKNFGRKIRDSEILTLALGLIQPEHIKHLQEQSLSQSDRLAMAHEDFQRSFGKISKDEFLGKLLRGEVNAQAQSKNQLKQE